MGNGFILMLSVSDGVYESGEDTITFTIISGTGYSVGSPSSATHALVDTTTNSPTSSPTRVCKDVCSTNTQAWETKCDWINICMGCAECTPLSNPTPSPTGGVSVAISNDGSVTEGECGTFNLNLDQVWFKDVTVTLTASGSAIYGTDYTTTEDLSSGSA